jgi:hypothetical protein
MDVIDVSERWVPGGRLREFTTADDIVIGVFTGSTGGAVQLSVRRATADAVDVAADLSDAEAVALAALLTGAKLVVTPRGDAPVGE